MPAESNDIRNKNRQVKKHILDKFLVLAHKDEEGIEWGNKDEAETYKELLLVFAKSVLPRTQEITGEDGDAINVNIVKYADIPTIPIQSTPVSAPASQGF